MFSKYFLKVTDADVGKYLKLFTLMPLNDIEEVLAAHVVCEACVDPCHWLYFCKDSTRKTESATPSCRRSDGISPYKLVFRKLVSTKAELILVLETGVLQAATMTKLLFGSEYTDLKFEDIIASFDHDPRLVKISKVEMLNTPITKLASKYGLVSSTCKNTVQPSL